MLKDRNPSWIICFGDHWGRNTMGSPGNIMIEFNKSGKKILWVNPIPKTNLSLKKTHGNKKIFLKRVWSKFKSSLKIISFHNSSFHILTPLYWPVVESKFGSHINPFLYRIQISLIIFLFRIHNFAVCNFTSNEVYKFIRLKKSISFLHIAADMHSDLRIATERQRNEILRNESEIFRLAEMIFPASERIKEKIIQRHGYREKIIVVPHGVDTSHFISVNESHPRMKSFPRPIIGYFGSLTFANDIDIYKSIAETGYTFILIGEEAGDYSAIKMHQNVHFFGSVPYSELPKYAFAFDVCIMAWKPSDWILNCNPKKTLEYLALGKPVVSISIPHLKEQFGHLIYFADEPTAFVIAIEKALKEDCNEKKEQRIAEAMKNDWSSVVNTISKELGWV